MTEHADGTLVFAPAVVMTAHEAALLRHPELVEQIKADRADPASAVRPKVRWPADPAAWCRGRRIRQLSLGDHPQRFTGGRAHEPRGPGVA